MFSAFLTALVATIGVVAGLGLIALAVYALIWAVASWHDRS